jgi:uncharacterized peroxidase-related enzyme
MPFIEHVTDEDAADEARALLDAERESLGYVQNLTRLLALRPDLFAAGKGRRDAGQGGMELRRYELATVAAATTLRSSYCSLAHGKILADRFLAPESVEALAAGGLPAELDAADAAVVELARKVAADAPAVTRADIARCREAGLGERDVLDVVLAASLRSFFSKLLDATDTEPDAVFRELEPGLRDALTFERGVA